MIWCGGCLHVDADQRKTRLHKIGTKLVRWAIYLLSVPRQLNGRENKERPGRASELPYRRRRRVRAPFSRAALKVEQNGRAFNDSPIRAYPWRWLKLGDLISGL